MEAAHGFIIDSQKALSRPFFASFMLQIPNSISMRKLLMLRSAFGQNSALKPAHVKQQIRVVFRVNADKTIFPLNCGDRAGETILDVPKHCTSPGK